MSKFSWYQRQKELKLKANHNKTTQIFNSIGLVSKIERTEIESKSQHSISVGSASRCWYQRQKELKLKANHNINKKQDIQLLLVSKIERTEIESKSQPSGEVNCIL